MPLMHYAIYAAYYALMPPRAMHIRHERVYAMISTPRMSTPMRAVCAALTPPRQHRH